VEAFSEEAKELYRQWQELESKLSFHKKRDDYANYAKTWEKIEALKRKFLDMNDGDSWD
jgi:hypothetical protein